MSDAPYDELADTYEKTINERSDRACIFLPSARHYLGELGGLDVLDLACGAGFFTRPIKRWGARKVVGVDLSREMIALAKAEEAKHPLGIAYREGDVATLGVLGAFDVVFAGFLLHYSPTVDALRAMCRNIAANLKPGGRFVAFNENPHRPLHADGKYDVVSEAEGPIRDGVKIWRRHVEGGRVILSFHHHHYEPATYGAALAEAGFRDVAWKPFVKSPKADEGFPPGYWDEFCGDFSVRVLTARKEDR